MRVTSTTLPLIEPDLQPGVFENVSNALYENRWRALDDKSFAGKAAPCEVMPLRLAQQGPRLSLVSRHRGFENERTLAMHRILSAKAFDPNFLSAGMRADFAKLRAQFRHNLQE